MASFREKALQVVRGIASIPDRMISIAHKGFNTAVPAALPAYLGGGGPGGWVSNHWQESRQITGATFTAIKAVARTCAKSTVHVHAVGSRARKHLDKAMRMATKGLIPHEVVVALKASVVASESGDDSVPLPNDFPLVKLLRRPNRWMTQSQFLYQHAQQASATGTTLIWTRRNQFRQYDARGVPVQGELYIVPTGVTYPMPPSRENPDGAYRIMPIGSYGGYRPDLDGFSDGAWTNLMLSGGVIDGREINPVRWPHPIFLTDGLSPMAAGDLWIDIANQLDRATWAGCRNTLRPGYIFQLANGIEEPSKEESERFDMWISSRNAGIENVGKHMRLPKGIEIADSDRSVHELDYVNGRQAIMQDVQSLWAVPPIASGYQQAGAYAAYFAALLQFTEQAVDPVLQLLADDLEHDLAPAYGGDLEIKIVAPAINDKVQRENEFAIRADAHALTFNEFRKSINLPPYPDKIGDLPCGTPIGQLMAHALGIELTPEIATQMADGTFSGKPGEEGTAKIGQSSEPGDTGAANPKGQNPGANGKPKPPKKAGPNNVPVGRSYGGATSRNRVKEFIPIMLHPGAQINSTYLPKNGRNGKH